MRSLTVKEQIEVDDYLSDLDPALRYKLEMYFKNDGSYNQGYRAAERKFQPLVKAIKDVLGLKIQTASSS